MSVFSFIRLSSKAIFPTVLLLCLGLPACSEPPDHKQSINNNIRTIVQAIETLDQQQLLGKLDHNADILHQGRRIETEEIKRIMTLYRLRRQTVSVNIISVEIELDNYNSQLAKVSMDALVTGRGKGMLPDEGRLYTINSQWRLFDDEWKPNTIYIE